jgi:hypothetical protein
MMIEASQLSKEYGVPVLNMALISHISRRGLMMNPITIMAISNDAASHEMY